jgi:uncharacterized protein YndB with AHSA1/START domain
MTLKKDPSGRRSVQVEVDVPGTPEEVWRAIATGPGISAWFVPTRSDERAGGEIVCTFGPGMDVPATITQWDAPRRFVAEGTMGPPGSPTMATEWIVEARAGGTCVVRVVHSLFASTDDWDNQLDGLEQGWPAYFRVLRRYLETFKGAPCSAMQFIGFSTDAESAAWQKLGGALGLVKVTPGQPWAAPAGVPRATGVIDTLGRGSHANTVLLGIDTPAPGTAYIGAFSCAGMVQVYIAFFLYGSGAAAAVARDQPAWQAWLDEHFPMPQMG